MKSRNPTYKKKIGGKRKGGKTMKRKPKRRVRKTKKVPVVQPPLPPGQQPLPPAPPGQQHYPVYGVKDETSFGQKVGQGLGLGAGFAVGEGVVNAAGDALSDAF
jgi:hypothetical protein